MFALVNNRDKHVFEICAGKFQRKYGPVVLCERIEQRFSYIHILLAFNEEGSGAIAVFCADACIYNAGEFFDLCKNAFRRAVYANRNAFISAQLALKIACKLVRNDLTVIDNEDSVANRFNL